MTAIRDLVEIGVVRKAHGIRGEAVVEYFAENPALLDGDVFVQTRDRPLRRVKTLSFRPHQGCLLVRFEGITTRSDAVTLRGARIFVPATRLPKPDDNETYVRDLVGMRVVLDADDTVVGVVDAVDPDAPQELWRITTPDGRETLFPAVPDFVRSIDPHSRIIRIAPPPGLFELF